MTEKNIDNWIFRITDTNELEVIPPKEVRKEKPVTLFKYYFLNEYSLKVLEELEIFASHPKLLNDPFDSHDALIAFDDKESIKTYLGPTLGEPEIKHAFENDISSLIGFVQYNFRAVLYGRLGIYSMTEKPENLLMWSYYTGHKGFCLELDYKNFPFKFHGPFQVKYSESFTPLSIKNGGYICMLHQALLKAQDWIHEQEWRLLPEREGAKLMELRELDTLKDLSELTNRNFPIKKENISRIILGNQFFDNDNELTPTQEGLIVTLKTNVDFKNRLINAAEKNETQVEIIFRNEPKFGFRTEPIIIERLDDKNLIIKKNPR